MKKIIVCLLCLVMILALASCGGNKGNDDTNKPSDTNKPTGDVEGEVTDDPFDGLSVMSYDEYMAADVDAPVYIEAYVQAHQSWWNNKITVYAADEDGAYFIYEMACSEEDAAKLTAGTKIAVKGYKGEWAGEIEIMDATFEFAGSDKYIAEAVDLTDVIGTDELIDYQNQLAHFSALTVEKIEFKNDGGDDIYLTVSKDGKSYSFCVEVYLTGTDSEVYKAVSALNVGDLINVEGFLYWYNGVNTHVTSVENAVLSYEEYMAANIDDFVIIDAYVQAHQSWWSNKITVYAADQDGAYFIYEMACSEEDAAKLVPGTKIRVFGYKGEWAGEIEIMDATFEFIDGDSYIATPVDVTNYLGTDALVNYQNQLVSFKGLTIESISYKNDGGDDIYVGVSYNGASYSFCVEVYLTGTSSDTYKAVQALNVGDVVDIEGFLYWYEGVNTHITNVISK